MKEPDDSARTAMRAIAVAALALAGLTFSLAPIAASWDDALLDREWRLLRKLDPRPADDDIIIVGIDPASVAAIAEPPGLWHASLGLALARIAAAKPRAIGLDFALPERSFEALRPGLDRALFTGLAAAIQNGPFVAVLNIDPRTRSARRIHTPFLALLGETRLGIGMLARDGDGVTRRYSLLMPTEDGGFPTLAGRLCRALARPCNDGLVNFALGAPLHHVSLKSVLSLEDRDFIGRLFRDRIVLIGETQPYEDRINVPVNLAGWETESADSPAIVVQAQALRTALAMAAPQEASRPLVVVLLSLAALVFLVRDWKLALATAALAAIATFVAALAALRAGLFVPAAPILLTLVLACAARAVAAWRGRGRNAGPSNIRHSG